MASHLIRNSHYGLAALTIIYTGPPLNAIVGRNLLVRIYQRKFSTSMRLWVSRSTWVKRRSTTERTETTELRPRLFSVPLCLCGESFPGHLYEAPLKFAC